MTRSGQGRSHDPQVQERLREMTGKLRHLLYGEEGCPEWGTTFAEIERDSVAVGSELGRLLIEQSVDEQAERMPAEALQTEQEPAQPGGTEGRRLRPNSAKWPESSRGAI